MMPQDSAFRQLKDAVCAVFFLIFLIARDIALVGVEQEVIYIQDTVRLQNPVDFGDQGFLYGIVMDTSQYRKKDDRIKAVVRIVDPVGRFYLKIQIGECIMTALNHAL